MCCASRFLHFLIMLALLIILQGEHIEKYKYVPLYSRKYWHNRGNTDGITVCNGSPDAEM